MFEVGEIINPEDWGLRIQITSVKPLEAVVIKSEPVYESQRAWADKYFPVGRVLRFEQGGSDTSWIIVSSDKEMPWFVLGIYEGRKRFEHYR